MKRLLLVDRDGGAAELARRSLIEKEDNTMTTEIRVPTLGESISEATIAQWFKSEGETVSADEPLLELETDKVTVEVPAPAAGILTEILAKDGETVEVGALLGAIGEGVELKVTKHKVEKKAEPAPAVVEEAAPVPAESADAVEIEIVVPVLGESVAEATVAQWFKAEGDSVTMDEPLVELETDKVALEVPAPASGVLARITVAEGENVEVGAVLGIVGGSDGAVVAPKPVAPVAEVPGAQQAGDTDVPLAPSVRRIVEEKGLDPAAIEGTGKGGRITKEDAIGALAQAAAPVVQKAKAPAAPTAPAVEDPREERIPMTRLRRTIATRLKEAQTTAAMLTTFNEVDMKPVMDLRKEYKDLFEQKHGVKLGFMSMFVKACLVGLKDIPAVNAEIDGTDLVYKNYYNIGVAVGTDKGLVVPVVRDADQLSLSGIEKAIAEFGRHAREGSLKLEDLQGGTFTISNGGVYGSLMSTPILNMPQSGILGMHKIQERPVVINGQVEIRPMMYLALSYDHRIIDGKEAVTFLVRVKECLESPQRMLLDL